MLKIIPWLLFSLVAFLLYKNLSQINPTEVLQTMSQISWMSLSIALSLCILDYALLCTFEFLTFHHLKIKLLSPLRIYYAAFICYAFTLNLGSLVGGLGMRYRLYPKYGVEGKKIPLIIAFSTSTNWLGYAFLFGMTSLFGPHKLATLTKLPPSFFLGLGLLGISLVGGYFYVCKDGKKITVKGHDFPLPDKKTALLQLLLATLQWCLLGGILFTMMHGMGLHLPFESILFGLLSASVMALFIHVPAGLGVIEGVFLALKFEAPAPKILAALVAFRIVYYLIPLLIAAPLYLLSEFRDRKSYTRFPKG